MSEQINAFIQAARNVVRAETPWKINPESRHIHQTALPHATLAPWYGDELFVTTYKKIASHTLVDLYRCYELWSLARQTADIEGDILEVGVWRGGTGALIAQATKGFPGKKVFLADTFAGVVKAGEHDPDYNGGEHNDTSIDTVVDLFDALDVDGELLIGIFPDDTASAIPGKLSLLHCDVDVYQSAKDIVEWALPRLSVGGIIIFDDYGFSTCEGIATYCEELRGLPGFRFIHNLNGHALLIKTR